MKFFDRLHTPSIFLHLHSGQASTPLFLEGINLLRITHLTRRLKPAATCKKELIAITGVIALQNGITALRMDGFH